MTRKRVATGLLSAVFLVTEFLLVYSLLGKLEVLGILSVAAALLALTTRYAAAKW